MIFYLKIYTNSLFRAPTGLKKSRIYEFGNNSLKILIKSYCKF